MQRCWAQVLHLGAPTLCHLISWLGMEMSDGRRCKFRAWYINHTSRDIFRPLVLKCWWEPPCLCHKEEEGRVREDKKEGWRGGRRTMIPLMGCSFYINYVFLFPFTEGERGENRGRETDRRKIDGHKERLGTILNLCFSKSTLVMESYFVVFRAFPSLR